MGEINWGLAVPPNTAQSVVDGFSKGYQMAKEHKVNNALAQFATNPDDPNAVNALTRVDPRLGMQARQQQATQAAARRTAENDAREQRQQHFLQVGKLLEGVTDEATYQQRLATARQMGMKVDGAPPAYDPNWVNETRAVAHVFTKDGGQTISGIARELEDAGYKQGTPEFQQAMKGVIQNKYASDYVDEEGNTRRRSALQLGGGPQAAPPVGAPVRVQSIDEAKRLPPGTRFLDPNGVERTVPGGPTQPASGTFQR